MRPVTQGDDPSSVELARLARFGDLAKAMPQLVWTADADGRVEYLNEQWVRYTGVDVERARNSRAVEAAIHSEDVAEMRRRWEVAKASSSPMEVEYRLRSQADGSYRWFLVRVVPVCATSGVVRWIGTATDVDEQKRSRDSLAFVLQAYDAIAAAPNEEAIYERVAALAIARFADWCFVTVNGNDEQLRVAAMAHKDASRVQYLEQFRDRYPPSADSPLRAVMARNVPLLVEHVTDDLVRASAQNEEHLELLRLLQMRSAMVIPISGASGESYGAVTLASAESGRVFTSEDLAIASTVCRRAGDAIAAARLFDEEKRTSQRLRFTAKATKLLFESLDLHATFERVTQLIVAEMADACVVARIDGDGLRVESAAHRDPKKSAILERMVGLRVLQPWAERGILAQLETGTPIVRPHMDPGDVTELVWPYLQSGVAQLGPTSCIVVPMRSRGVTLGGIFVYYTDSAREYSEDDVPVFLEIAARASVAVENTATLDRERHIAETLQKASLPALVPKPSDITLRAVYSAAGDEAEVGGDWYDAIELDDGSIAVSVGDVTGRGLQAAVIMSKVRHAMGVLPRHERDPARILDSCEWFLRKRYPDAIVTAFVGVISPDRRRLRYATAGHPPPLLKRGAEILELRADGLPLGLRDRAAPASSAEHDLGENDLLVLFTDGLIEWSRNGEEGERCLRAVLATDAAPHASNSAKFVQQACVCAEKAHDDIAVLTVYFAPAPEWSFAAENALVAQDARALFMRHLRAGGIETSLAARAELVFGELIGNIVRHAPGPADITLTREGDALVLHVMDTGPSFQLNPSLPNDPLSESGRGLFIVRELASRLELQRVDGYGNYVRATIAPDGTTGGR